jgi:hypothetical protein
MFGSHRFNTYRLKLIETPIVTSKQPVRGKIIGTSEHVGSDMT